MPGFQNFWEWSSSICYYTPETRPHSLNRVHSQFFQGSKIPDAAWDRSIGWCINDCDPSIGHNNLIFNMIQSKYLGAMYAPFAIVIAIFVFLGFIWLLSYLCCKNLVRRHSWIFSQRYRDMPCERATPNFKSKGGSQRLKRYHIPDVVWDGACQIVFTKVTTPRYTHTS